MPPGGNVRTADEAGPSSPGFSRHRVGIQQGVPLRASHRLKSETTFAHRLPVSKHIIMHTIASSILLRAALLCGPLVSLTGCDNSSSNAAPPAQTPAEKAITTNTGGQEGKPLSELPADVQAFYAEFYVVQGESAFTKGPVEDNSNAVYIMEYRGASFAWQPVSLTDADRLNGIAAIYKISMRAKVRRRYVNNDYDRFQGWRKWLDVTGQDNTYVYRQLGKLAFGWPREKAEPPIVSERISQSEVDVTLKHPSYKKAAD